MAPVTLRRAVPSKSSRSVVLRKEVWVRWLPTLGDEEKNEISPVFIFCRPVVPEHR